MRRHPWIVRSCLVAGLMGCTQFPQIETAALQNGSDQVFPTLLPLAPVLAAADQRLDDSIPPTLVGNTESRVNSLLTRAARLRGPVIGANTRARMQRGVRLAALR